MVTSASPIPICRWPCVHLYHDAGGGGPSNMPAVTHLAAPVSRTRGERNQYGDGSWAHGVNISPAGPAPGLPGLLDSPRSCLTYSLAAPHFPHLPPPSLSYPSSSPLHLSVCSCHVTLVHFKNRIGDRRVGLGAARLSEMILADSGKTLQAGTAEETGEVCPCQQICHPH